MRVMDVSPHMKLFHSVCLVVEQSLSSLNGLLPPLCLVPCLLFIYLQTLNLTTHSQHSGTGSLHWLYTTIGHLFLLLSQLSSLQLLHPLPLHRNSMLRITTQHEVQLASSTGHQQG